MYKQESSDQKVIGVMNSISQIALFSNVFNGNDELQGSLGF